MRYDAEKLFALLPAVYRTRDAEAGGPLRALLSVIADQANVLQNDLEQLYDDQFVETAAPWVLPYIGDLIGITGLPSAGASALGARAEVAHTIGYRRRKGTAAMLEQLARDVTGWPARAVEFFQLLATTQYMNHLRPENKSFLDVRDADRLEYLGTAFEHLEGQSDIAHTADVRRVASRRGRYNIPNVGIFLWRLRAYSLTRSHAVAAAPGDKRHFFFSPLGNDTPLFNLPLTEQRVTSLAEPINVPARITRRALAVGELDTNGKPIRRPRADYYGDGTGFNRSFFIEVAGNNISQQPTKVQHADMVVCDLSDWKQASTTYVSVDPVLGRVAFPADPAGLPLLSFHYGFSGNVGGGEYSRVGSLDLSVAPDRVVTNTPVPQPWPGPNPPPASQTIQPQLNALVPTGGLVEILDSGRYKEGLILNATDKHLELRAADKRRPSIVLTAPMQITGKDEGEVTINGLLISGDQLIIGGTLRKVRLLHCTLVPGISLNSDGTPAKVSTPSLVLNSPQTALEIESCIVGGLRAPRGANVRVTNSVVDATNETGVAYSAQDNVGAGGPLRVVNSTIIGKVHADVLELVSNSILLAEVAAADKAKWPAPVRARKRQEGCVRFSYLPAGSSVPRRFRCQPKDDSDASRVRPLLVSSRYGDPAYCQLSPRCPVEIFRGADDESEMGVFHDLYGAQREAHLTARLEEYLRFGLEAGVFYAT